ncbi:phage tail tape measure protein [Metapseudomonas furukawaii]
MANTLGTLTLDLVARIGGFTGPLDKAAAVSQKRMADIKKSVEVVGQAVGAAGIAAAAGLAAMTVNTVRTATEITRLSSVANASTEEFQRYAAGAQAVGIEQDKLADIFKDVNDKVGDFMQTGGGALADFFENVAPKVGVTADQFRKLSGPEALGLYVSSLERAGASQQDMTFYLEAIASDATALLPLLKNNAEGFRLLGDQAAAAGAILDNDTIRAAHELQAVSILTDKALEGMRNQIMDGLLPVLAGLSEEFFALTADGVSFTEVGETIGEGLKFIAKSAVGAATSVKLVAQGIAGLAFIASQVPEGFDAVRAAAGQVGDELDATAQSAADMIAKIEAAGSDKTSGGLVSRIADLLGEVQSTGRSAGVVIDQVAGSSKKAADAIRDQISTLELQAATVGMSTEQETLYKLALDGATQAQLGQAAAALGAVAAFEKQKEAQEAYRQLLADLRTEEEQLTDQLRERLAVLDAIKDLPAGERSRVAGRIAAQATAEAPEFAGLAPEVGGPLGELDKIEQAEEELQQWYETQLDMLEQFREERADLTATWDAEELSVKQQHEAALAQIEDARRRAQLAAGEEFFGNMASAAKAFFGEQSGLYRAAFAVEKAYAISKALLNVPKSYSDAFAAVVGIPVVGPVLAPVAGATAAAAQVAQAAMIGNIGMAHDGIDSIPETGSWYLKKGERVTTAETSAKLDNTLDRLQRNRTSAAPEVNIHNAPAGAHEVRTREQDGRFIIDVVLQSFMGDGELHQAVGAGKYGLSTVGT